MQESVYKAMQGLYDALHRASARNGVTNLIIDTRVIAHGTALMMSQKEQRADSILTSSAITDTSLAAHEAADESSEAILGQLSDMECIACRSSSWTYGRPRAR